ncbi:hypothetical protein B0H11DRAFT_1946479 [Mycena galericulata]|nr:hypothetical protein B0H11DRAFT_1946479 [Mycena galericulata]
MATKHAVRPSDEIFSDLETIDGGPMKDNIYVEPLGDNFDPFSLDEVWDEFDSSPVSSTPLKRVLLWSDDEGDGSSSSGSERDPKRPKTRSLSPISLTTSSLETSVDYEIYPQLPWDNYGFRNFREHPEAVYVDKTRFIPQLSDSFRHLLLRPPRFGKTAFLSMLAQYYDIRAVDQFNAYFGSLAVGTCASDNSLPHSQHLCLSFDLADIHFLSDIAQIRSALASHVVSRLLGFVMKYAAELKVPDPATFLSPEDQDVEPKMLALFQKVFELVRSRRYTLFVGVDDYDAPTRLRAFMHLHYPEIREGFASVQDIEDLLDLSFWGPLHAGLDVITKLFVTGTLSLSMSPRMENLHKLDLLETPPSFQLSCGFTEQEALQFSRAFLHEPPSLVELRRTCGEYNFSCNDPAAEPVLHPQQLILHIAELSKKPLMVFAPESFPLLSGIFDLLPEESAAPAAVTIYGLIDLLACGTVEIDDSTPCDFDGTAVTWRTLFDLGALTYDCKGAVRVANSVVLSLIHEHVDRVFADRHDWQALHAYNTDADPHLILGLFSAVLCNQTQLALGTNHAIEPSMRGIFELILRSRYSRQKIDPVILPSEVADDSVVEITHCWDNAEPEQWVLKTLTLRGMWRGASPNNDEPTIDDLRRLHAGLICEDEARLMERPYHDAGTGLVALVGSYLKAEPNISVFLAVGGARVLCSSHVHA